MKKFLGRNALLRDLSFVAAMLFAVRYCECQAKGGVVYSPKVDQIDASYNAIESSRFKDVEEEARRWDDSKNIPSWARETPEAAARRRQLEQRFEEERKSIESEANQERLQRKKEEQYRNSFGGKREQQEKEFLDGRLFPEATQATEMDPLKQKAEELAKSIDWGDVERIYNKLTQLIESARMARGLSGKEGDLNKIRKEFIAEWESIVERLEAHYEGYGGFAKSLQDEKKRALFASYFDEAASKAAPRTFTHTAGRFVDAVSKIAEEIGEVVPQDLLISQRYRMFLDVDR